MKKAFSLIVAVALLLCTTVTALGAVIYQYGRNVVTNTESWEFFYNGTGTCSLETNVNGKAASKVALRYLNGMQGDTGFVWSSNATVLTPAYVTLSYNDSLNPFAPQVRFNYEFAYIPYGATYNRIALPEIER